MMCYLLRQWGQVNKLLRRRIKFEFWPVFMVYFPVFFYYLWLSFRSRSLTFFTAANPGIYLGGFIGESKYAILQRIGSKYLPAGIFFKANTAADEVLLTLGARQIHFPVVIKPDKGERGKGVEKIDDCDGLKRYLETQHHDFIIQEFIHLPMEAGVMYYRFPDESASGITSLVLKNFLSVTGDGCSTIEELIENNERALSRKMYLLAKYSFRLKEILPHGEQLLLEPIGNHCRGTEFVSGQQYITPDMVRVFDGITKHIDGFYIGRFDLKVNSMDDLYSGSNIRIMELNGVTSEPAHIYDPEGTLKEAYRSLFQHYYLVFRIASQNILRGVKPARFRLVLNAIRNGRTDV